ncbi:sperm associated antigen 9a isoform X2 [Girardinichthys multiradiatus]|uniref:sperm associated antigen 9a isoform X2 n=1 Tax=Girardinichthys multiradiatus TaxID=208333 RepID=UPI001FABDEFE|nr:sperm associated antigen 9a isoform X2 [Girardinichthys multiradiatus]
MELEDGVVYQDDPGTSAMMSERVSGLASSIYREFERLIGKYDEDVVKELMPLVVAVLENLDSVFAENQEHEVELELLKEDNEQLITQYEREKALRKHAEEKFIEFEDTHEQEKKDLQNLVDRMESHSRQLELKIKNYSDQISRLEENELVLKKECNTLHQRRSEMIHNYMEHMERIKMQQISETSESTTGGRVRKERPLSLGIFPPSGGASLIIPDSHTRVETPGTEGWRFSDSSQLLSNTSLKLDFVNPPEEREGKSVQDPTWGNSLADDCKDELSDITGSKSTTGSDMEKEEGNSKSTQVQAAPGTRTISDGLPENEENSDVQDIIESTPELDMDLIGYKPCSTPTKGIENLAFDRNTDSLFEELSSAGMGLIGDVDEGADLLDLSLIGMGREVENLIQENSQLLETKNALNVVNKDLILKVDELTCEKEVLQGEMEALLQAKNKIEEKNRKLEEELKKVRQEVEEVKQNSKDEEDSEVPTAQRKRFTRVEMARVLMERNQYKERLMELQEAVRWTEMIRASRENPTLTEKKRSSIWQFFSRLFSSSSSSSVMKTVEDQSKLKYNSPGSLVKRSSTFSQFPTEKSKIFDFMNEGTEQCSSPSHKEKKKAQYRQVKAHMQKEDGRVTVHGWSLPSKHKVVNGGQMENKMNLPVSVYLRPLDQKDASMKLWCAAGVNLSGGRRVPSSEMTKQIKGSQSSLDQLEQENKEKGEKELIVQDEISSRVWVCMSTSSSTKVMVLDATQPTEVLDTFYACNTHVACIASVPGVLDSDYPAGEEVLQEPEASQGDGVSLAGSVASVGSTGSDGAAAAEGVTAVLQTASLGVSEQPAEYSATSGSVVYFSIPTVQLSRETSPTEDGVPTAEEATEATEANAGVGEGEEDQGAYPNQPGIYTEHVFTDPLGVGPTDSCPAEAQRGLVQDGEPALPEVIDTSDSEVLRMSSALPTMWLGAQNGCLYVHSSVARWRKCLHAIKLKDSILSVVHVKGRVLVALADGTLAIFHRGAEGQWDLTNYHLLDLGRPHHSIRCMTVVHDKVWCGYRNKIYVIQPKAMRIEKSFDAHPRKESQVRQLAWVGDGIWVSIRLDSTLRLFHAHTYQHLQDVDIEPYVSKMLGTGKLGFSFVRITALVVSCNRLWVGTGNGVIISIPLSEANKTAGIVSNRPGSAVRVYSDDCSEGAVSCSFVPYCSMAHAQLCFHGHRDAVKFFVTVPGQAMPPPGSADSGSDDPPSESSDTATSEPKTYLVMSGGEGYIDFRIGDEGSELDGLSEQASSQPVAPAKTERSHLIVWQVATPHE